MRKCSLLLLLGVFPFLASCGSSKPKDLIIGKWESTDPKNKGETMEFLADGKIVLPKMEGMPPEAKVEAKYKFVSDDEMEVEITFNIPGIMPKPETKTEKVKVQVTKDELTTTDSKNKTEKMKRAK